MSSLYESASGQAFLILRHLQSISSCLDVSQRDPSALEQMKAAHQEYDETRWNMLQVYTFPVLLHYRSYPDTLIYLV
jgi:hypothetical protein